MTGRLARACAGLLLALAAGLAPARAPADPPVGDFVAPSPGRLVVATTTSVRDSGLMDALLPLFESESGYDVELIAVGSGAALRMAATGEADVVVSHAPEEEQRLVAGGALEDRRPFMYGYFVLAGPAADPARVAEAASASDAVRRIAAAEAPYVSRGDESGTHLREQGLFRAAGLAHAARWTGFASTGSGMGPTLLVAGERRAYALADRATFEAFRARTDLAALFEEREPALRNDYAVLRPAARGRAPRVVDVAGARRFADFLLAPATQARIGQFGRDADGAPLFHPGVGER